LSTSSTHPELPGRNGTSSPRNLNKKKSEKNVTKKGQVEKLEKTHSFFTSSNVPGTLKPTAKAPEKNGGWKMEFPFFRGEVCWFWGSVVPMILQVGQSPFQAFSNFGTWPTKKVSMHF